MLSAPTDFKETSHLKPRTKSCWQWQVITLSTNPLSIQKLFICIKYRGFLGLFLFAKSFQNVLKEKGNFDKKYTRKLSCDLCEGNELPVKWWYLHLKKMFPSALPQTGICVEM